MAAPMTKVCFSYEQMKLQLLMEKDTAENISNGSIAVDAFFHKLMYEYGMKEELGLPADVNFKKIKFDSIVSSESVDTIEKNKEKENVVTKNVSVTVNPEIDDYDRSTFQWPHWAILNLISLVKEHKEKFDSPRYTQKQVWAIICDKLNSTGNNRKYWEYFSIMENVIGRRPDVTLLATYDSSRGLMSSLSTNLTPANKSSSSNLIQVPSSDSSSSSSLIQIPSNNSSSPAMTAEPSNRRNKRKREESVPEWVKILTNKMDERREEKAEVRKKLYGILENLVDKL